MHLKNFFYSFLFTLNHALEFEPITRIRISNQYRNKFHFRTTTSLSHILLYSHTYYYILLIINLLFNFVSLNVEIKQNKQFNKPTKYKELVFKQITI